MSLKFTYIKVHSQGSQGLDKCMMSCTHVTASRTILHHLGGPLCSPAPPLPSPGSRRPAYRLPSFAFSRMSHKWDCMVCSLSDWLLSPSRVQSGLLVSAVPDGPLFLSRRSISPCASYSVLICSPAEAHPSSFLFLAILSKDTINICMQVFM